MERSNLHDYATLKALYERKSQEDAPQFLEIWEESGEKLVIIWMCGVASVYKVSDYEQLRKDFPADNLPEATVATQ